MRITYILRKRRKQKQEKAIEKPGRETKLRSLYTREREEREEEDEERGRESGESDSVYPLSIGDREGRGSETRPTPISRVRDLQTKNDLE